MKATTKPYRELSGDWRRRLETKTDAHLWRNTYSTGLPMCQRNIPRSATEAVDAGRPCADCLVAAIRAGA